MKPDVKRFRNRPVFARSGLWPEMAVVGHRSESRKSASSGMEAALRAKFAWRNRVMLGFAARLKPMGPCVTGQSSAMSEVCWR